MILLIDNYDSFTYNLYQYLEELGEHVKVIRNDAVTVKETERLKPRAIVISPGPGNPNTAGISVDMIRHWKGRVPILGVCLGHQCIGAAFGGDIIRAKKLMHGKISQIQHQNLGVFKGLKNPFEATRYHSLVVSSQTLPKELKVTARSEDGEIMGLKHVTIPALEGVQFHPESILTSEGKKLLKNFLKMRIPK